jgi:hypothetical protein
MGPDDNTGQSPPGPREGLQLTEMSVQTSSTWRAIV